MSLEAVREFFASLWGLWLLALLVGIAAWAFWPRNRARFEDASRIPLRDEEPGRKEDRPTRDGGELDRDADKH